MSISRDPNAHHGAALPEKGPDSGCVPIVILGARIVRDPAEHALGGAIGRRAREGARLYAEIGAPLVVASGGCAWGGVVEADAILETLVLGGVPRAIITRDRCSLSTRDNARYVARALAKRGYHEAIIVTCAWHVGRAVTLFRREGIVAHPHPVDEPPVPLRTRFWRWGHEKVAMRLGGVM